MSRESQLEPHYRRWIAPEIVEKYRDKKVGDFFLTETHFLDEIAASISSVLDVGCSCGRLIELLKTYRQDIDYEGIDLSVANIETARSNYPEFSFHCGNALSLPIERSFDLVNATGVLQHEPEFEALICTLLKQSRRYVLFDIKAAAIKEHLCDISQSYSGRDDKVYFIILSYVRLKQFLGRLPEVAEIRLFGYPTSPNNMTTTPAWLQRFASLGVLLIKGAQSSNGARVAEENVPEFLSA
jgi:SAM-dependent methyltransferase